MGGCISSAVVLGCRAMKKNLYIKAINPGYTIDGFSNVGEMIEISRTEDSDELVSLAGLILDYTNSSGNRAVLVEFPEHTYLAGERILLRLASSPESELAAMTYSKTLAFKAEGLRLMDGEEVIDAVCWDSSEGCEKEFKSKTPTVLVRGEDGEFLHVGVDEYEVVYDPEAVVVDSPDENEGVDTAEVGAEAGMGAEVGMGAETETEVLACAGVEFSEILSYYKESQSEQFVELHNASGDDLTLNGCFLRYKNKTYPLDGALPAGGYLARYLTDFRVAKNPSSIGVVELVDANGKVVDTLEYPNGQKKGTSFALVGYEDGEGEEWATTYAVTPGSANVYQEFRNCDEGKMINPETGNCIKIPEVVKEVKICEEGYYLNEETGRCKKLVINDGANYELVPETYREESSFIGLAAVLVVVGAAVIYVIFEFRHEIKKRIGFLKNDIMGVWKKKS